MSEKEFKLVLIDLGRRDVTDEQVKQMLDEADENGDGKLQWGEYVNVKIESDLVDVH
jgi:Ca2+-binding EF-hand superfamily protein